MSEHTTSYKEITVYYTSNNHMYRYNQFLSIKIQNYLQLQLYKPFEV